jgi:hypothetical protein
MDVAREVEGAIDGRIVSDEEVARKKGEASKRDRSR